MVFVMMLCGVHALPQIPGAATEMHGGVPGSFLAGFWIPRDGPHRKKFLRLPDPDYLTWVEKLLDSAKAVENPSKLATFFFDCAVSLWMNVTSFHKPIRKLLRKNDYNHGGH